MTTCVLRKGEPPSFLDAAVVLSLSVIADAIISVSLNLQKHAHNRNWDHAAGKPKRPFTRLPLWWVGMLLNVFGELGNLVAYGFAPASVVTPVGSVGVFCNAILASFFLKEPLRKRDLVGLCFIVAGVVLIVMGVPEAPGVLTAHVIAHEVMPHPRCWAYLLALSLDWHLRKNASAVSSSQPRRSAPSVPAASVVSSPR